MKKLPMIGFIMMTAFSSGQLIAGQKEWRSDQILNLEELNQKEIEGFSQGKLGEHILECSEGTYLPMNIILSGEFLALESANTAPLYLKVLKTCYIRCEEKENFLFSTDLQEWKEFSEFFTGRVNVSVKAEKDGTIAGLELELNQRKPS
jgi:hypothetical protein